MKRPYRWTEREVALTKTYDTMIRFASALRRVVTNTTTVYCCKSVLTAEANDCDSCVHPLGSCELSGYVRRTQRVFRCPSFIHCNLQWTWTLTRPNHGSEIKHYSLQGSNPIANRCGAWAIHMHQSKDRVTWQEFTFSEFGSSNSFFPHT